MYNNRSHYKINQQYRHTSPCMETYMLDIIRHTLPFDLVEYSLHFKQKIINFNQNGINFDN
jgi:hypothetical protein